MSAGVRDGYLLLADISGYTVFLTQNELEHAHGIIEDLTSGIIAELSAPWRFVKLEGDAVFVWAPAEAFPNGERVLEAIERCYCEFSDRKVEIVRRTTCQCRACANIGTLDLKFVGHFGQFLPQRVGAMEDLAGPDVIVVHRLLKNSVANVKGLRAYALLSDAVVQRLDGPANLVEHVEAYESIGEVRGAVEDLSPLPGERQAARRDRVTEEDADFSVTLELPVSRAVAWEYWTDARKLARWSGGTTGWETAPNEKGRTGLGAEFHCAHGAGRSRARYTDWRPFDYFTTQKSVEKWSANTPPAMKDTTEFVALDPAHTAVTYRFRVDDRGLRSRVLISLMKPMVRRMFRQDHARILALMAEDGAISAHEPDVAELETAAPQTA
jgi:hypothetical protein